MPITTTVLIHRNRLLAEGLKQILDQTRFKMKWAPNLESLLAEDADFDQAGSLFIIGKSSTADIAATVTTLRNSHSNAPIVILGDDWTLPECIHAFQAGINGHISETMSDANLVGALELIMQGDAIIPYRVVKALNIHATAKVSETAASYSTTPIAASAAEHEQTTGPCTSTSSLSANQATRAGTVTPQKSVTPPERMEGNVVEYRLPEQRLRPAGAIQSSLSPREIEILMCLVRGASNKEIARTLSMAEATVKVHLKGILRKIRVRNRTQAAIWAINHITQPKTSYSSPRLLA